VLAERDHVRARDVLVRHEARELRVRGRARRARLGREDLDEHGRAAIDAFGSGGAGWAAARARGERRGDEATSVRGPRCRSDDSRGGEHASHVEGEQVRERGVRATT
jgi:hypothetical protein